MLRCFPPHTRDNPGRSTPGAPQLGRSVELDRPRRPRPFASECSDVPNTMRSGSEHDVRAADEPLRIVSGTSERSLANSPHPATRRGHTSAPCSVTSGTVLTPRGNSATDAWAARSLARMGGPVELARHFRHSGHSRIPASALVTPSHVSPHPFSLRGGVVFKRRVQFGVASILPRFSLFSLLYTSPITGT